MSQFNGGLATEFCRAFCDCYEEARARFEEPTAWAAMWKLPSAHPGGWNDFMLHSPNSVINAAADRIGLNRCPGVSEPLHLDAAFVSRGAKSWFPMQMVLEHENSPDGFAQEICKLLSVRAPLKVGLTYSLGHQRRYSDLPHTIQREIGECLGKALIGEDGATEYLFLLGIETDPFTLRWMSLLFRAADGLAGAIFA